MTNIQYTLENKANEKQECFEYLRTNLPDICHRGNIISNVLCDIAKELEIKLKESPLNAESNYVDPDESVMSNVFGTG